jgi:ribosomal protein L37AE/L43A
MPRLISTKLAAYPGEEITMDENTSTFRTDFKRAGYSQEDAYFYRINRELIDRNRKELDLKRSSVQAAQKEKNHWMTCPKCGNKMSEKNVLGIQVEQCQACEGVYFDRAELNTLSDAKERHHFFNALNANTTWKP